MKAISVVGKDLQTFCPCAENLSEAKVEGNGPDCLVEEISR